jgi:hypothetical protein
MESATRGPPEVAVAPCSTSAMNERSARTAASTSAIAVCCWPCSSFRKAAAGELDGWSIISSRMVRELLAAVKGVRLTLFPPPLSEGERGSILCSPRKPCLDDFCLSNHILNRSRSLLGGPHTGGRYLPAASILVPPHPTSILSSSAVRALCCHSSRQLIEELEPGRG